MDSSPPPTSSVHPEAVAVDAARPARSWAQRLTEIALCGAALVMLLPMWAPLVLSSWFATLMRPLRVRLAKVLGGRERAAGLITLFLLLVMLSPLAIAGAGLYGGGRELVKKLLESKTGTDALASLVSSDGGGGADLPPVQTIISMVREHGAKALAVLSSVAELTGAVVLGLFVFVYGTYVFLVDGHTVGRWLEDHSPLAPVNFRRFSKAFHETGRGLLIGCGLTALAQGIVATIAYLALGVPRAFLLGLFTTMTALIPSIGTGLVWAPVAAGLFITGQITKGIILVAIGALIISTIDNLIRPLFSRWGKLEMSSFLFLVSVFGGLAIIGVWGLILGPLLVRLATEALAIARERRLSSQALSKETNTEDGQL